MTPFTLAELRTQSANYLDELKREGGLGHPKPRVCHHFFPLDGAEDDVYLPDLPERLKALGEDPQIDIMGDPVGLEVWFLREPDAGWIDPLILEYHEAAVACSAVYGGWSYEPDRRDEPASTDTIH